MKATTIVTGLVLGVLAGLLGFATPVGYAAGDTNVSGNLVLHDGNDILLRAKAKDIDAGDIVFQTAEGNQLARIWSWGNSLCFSPDANNMSRVIFDNGGNILLRAKTNDIDAGDLIFQTGQGNQLARIWSWGAGNLAFCTNPSNAANVVIDSVGNVGIGTVTPTTRLEVCGYVKARGYYTGDLFFQKDGQTLWRMFEDKAGLYVENAATGKKYDVVLRESGSAKPTEGNAAVAELKAENAVLKQKMADLEAKLEALAKKLP